MATTIRKTAYFSMKTPNRAGQGARLLGELAAHGVDLRAFTGFRSQGARKWISSRTTSRSSRVLRARWV